MKVLIVGGPQDGKVLCVQPDSHNMQFAVLDPKFFPLDPKNALGITSRFETVTSQIHRLPLKLHNGNECTLVLAVTEEAMKAMSISTWLELMSTAYKEGCML